MKRWFVTALLSVVALFASAQKYMRYHMNDGSFNGFYTDCVDSIVHTLEHTQVWTFGECHEIPLANIDTITFEGVDLGTDADDMVGRYRIYEYEVSPTDSIYNVYKKAYFDNRALLMTSKTGEFGANDTIMIHSEFYGGSLLMFTDDDGNICRVFDGKYMLDIITHEDGSSTVHLFGESSDSILATLELPVDLFEKYSYTRAVSVSSLQKALKGFVKKYKEIEARSQAFEKDHPIKSYLIEQGVSTLLVEGTVKLGEVLTDIESDPNYRNKVILIDAVQIVGDLAGIGFTALGGVLTGGALWAALGIEASMLMADFGELLEDTFLSSEVRENYEKYYEQKYGLMLHTQPAVDVTETGATLNGNVYTADGIKGNVSFRLWDYKGDVVEVEATITGSDGNYKYSFSAQVENLEPDTEYVYWIWYTCTINGMTFYYSSDNSVEFRTKKKEYGPKPDEAIDFDLCPDENHPHAIDLGLPSGIKWACCNVGASSPKECGGYYAWGETEEKETYYIDDYEYYNHLTGFEYIGSDISGTQYDVANTKMGGGWRMPTHDEIMELTLYCTQVGITYNGIKLRQATGPNGNRIFFPITGLRLDSALSGSDEYFHFWSATVDPDGDVAFTCSSRRIYFLPGSLLRYFGVPVRPVTE